mgnify:CR=1 FL=1
MRQSEFFTRTLREAPKDEVSINAQLLMRAGFVSKVMAGVYTILPMGLAVLKKIEGVIGSEMIALGGLEVLMPALQPKANWEQTGRWQTYDSLFKFTSFYTKNEYALGPTHEEIVTPLFQSFNLSYRDLPKAMFQIQTKFRDEARAKSGLLRGREFLMKDLYSFHADEKDLDSYYEKAREAYRRIFSKLGLGHVTFLTFASGGSFSEYSHEFQTLTSAGEDLIYICDKCDVAVNKEILQDQNNSCPECRNSDLREEKAVEVGNIFKLKTKYSDAFNLTYKNENGVSTPVIMGCYGVGITRLLGTLVEVHHDDKGIVWPEAVAPFKVHLIKIGDKREVGDFAENLYKNLLEKGIEVLFDDRDDVSVGEKFAEADLIGLPIRAVVSEKTISKNQIEIKKRSGDLASLVSEEEFLKEL